MCNDNGNKRARKQLARSPMEERAIGRAGLALEDVFRGELHLAGLQQQSASAAYVRAEVGAGAVGLQWIRVRCPKPLN